MNLTEESYTSGGDKLLYRLEVGVEGLDEMFEEFGIVPCHLMRNLLVEKLDKGALEWVESKLKELTEELEKNN
jgi:hypothetical protein